MSSLPILSGKEVISTLAKIGYRPVRQRGSHIRLSCPNKKSVTVPNHPVIGKTLLKKILRDIEITLAEFNKLID